MTWNYRIIRHTEPVVWFALHEVHYDTEGKPQSYTDPIDFVCDEEEGADGIIASLKKAVDDACKYSILNASDFEGAK